MYFVVVSMSRLRLGDRSSNCFPSALNLSITWCTNRCIRGTSLTGGQLTLCISWDIISESYLCYHPYVYLYLWYNSQILSFPACWGGETGGAEEAGGDESPRTGFWKFLILLIPFHARPPVHPQKFLFLLLLLLFLLLFFAIFLLDTFDKKKHGQVLTFLLKIY